MNSPTIPAHFLRRLRDFSILVCALTQTTLITAQAPETKKDEKNFANAILERALSNMAQLKGYHVEAEITTPAGKAKLTGDLGVGTLSLKGEDVKGNTKLRVVVDETFYLSADGGQTWKTGEQADRGSTIVFSQLITGPIDAGLKIWEKGDFQAMEEKLGKEDALHVEKPAKGKEPAVHFWIVREPKLENAVFIRKASMVIAAEDGDFPVTSTYTSLNEPAEIKAPVGK